MQRTRLTRSDLIMRIARVTGLTVTMMAAPAEAFSSLLHGQEPVPARCGFPGGAVVVGTVIDDSTGRPVARTRVHLLVPMCSTTADEAGRFRFEDARPGNQRVETAYPGYRRFVPIVVSAGAGDTVRVELRLLPGGPIQDCRIIPTCAPLLQESTTEPLNDEERLRLAAYGAAIAIAWNAVMQDGTPYACLNDESLMVLAELGRRYSRLAPGADCEFAAGPPPRFRQRMRHRPTEERAFLIRLDRAEDREPGLKRVSVWYVTGRLGGQGWFCDFERTATAWRPILCVQVWES